MKHIHYKEVEAQEVAEAGAHGVSIRTVIGEADGAPHFFMRVITFDAQASSPKHSHPWEHEAFILRGTGVVEVGGESSNLKAGDVVYIPPNVEHCFQTSQPMEMI